MHISAYETCLERIAEELMECRKWKHYQETLSKNYVNIEQTLRSSSREQQQQLPDKTHKTNNKLEKNNFELQNYLQLNHREPKQDFNGLHAEEKDNVSTHHNLSNGAQNKLQAPGCEPLKESENIKALLNDTQLSTLSNDSNHIADEGYGASRHITYNIKVVSKESPVRPYTVDLPDPVDWKPNDKCYFCVNGKLLTVNANGELVAESSPQLGDSDHITNRLDSESESNESSHIGVSGTLPNQLHHQEQLTLHELLTSQLKNLPANMTSMDSMVKRLAALQTTIPGQYPNFNWLMAQQQQQNESQQPNELTSVTPTTSEITIAAISPLLKELPSPSDATGEQPLDLSSKQSPNSSIVGDLKTVRVKSHTPAVRRTYTNEDLTNALQDVISRKSGTRKAAVQYNIPRSTLRNKINKHNSEAKRNCTPTTATELELSSDEDGEESNASTPHPILENNAPIMQDFANRLHTSNTLRKLCENNGGDLGDESSNTSPKPNIYQSENFKRQSNQSLNSVLPLTLESPQAHQPINWIEPNIQVLLQSLILSTGGLAALQPKLDEPVTYRELLSNMFLNLGINLKDLLPNMQQSNQLTSTDESTLNNGKSSDGLEQRLLQQLQQQQLSAQIQSGFPKSETPDTTSSMDTTEACDDAVSLLKIPSFKPVAGPTSNNSGSAAAMTSSSSALLCNNIGINTNNTVHSNSMHRNGESPHSTASPQLANSMLAAAVTGHRQGNSLADLSQPSLHGQQIVSVCGSQTPPSFSLRDVITNSIHRKMNEHTSKETHTSVSMLGLGADNERKNSNGNGDYKKPTISVVKNIGGTDTSRFGTAPNLLATGALPHNSHHTHHSHTHPHLLQPNHHQRHQAEQLSRQEAAALAAGKGTRPKRGKYRNYDRDSLIEAVKAVQRGEMSVHRAGSYYGVPHSTLEYKVKERHLMRQRKREPKPQPGLDGSASSGNTGKTNTNIPGHNSHDKGKTSNSNASNSKLSNALKNNQVTASTVSASNGIKLPIFDGALTNPYASQLFWTTQPAFNALQMDFNRNSSASAEIFKSMQRFQEEALRAASGSSANLPPNTNTPSPLQSPLSVQNQPPLQITSARELAENLYDNDLDGIIRKTLDRKSADALQTASPSVNLNNCALLDQLLVKKSPLPFTNNRNNEYASPTTSQPIKRCGSPITFGAEIKRERTSPQRSTDDDHDAEDDDDGNETSCSALGTDETHHEHNNNNNNNKNNNNNDNRQERSRRTSRDSETDGSSVKSELQQILQAHHNNNSTNNRNLANMNGKSVILDTGSSILQEKLAQIKSEQADTDDNL